MENKQKPAESEGSSICSDLDQLNLADFGLDEDFEAKSNFAFGELVATENDVTDGEIEKMKAEMEELKKEIEAMKLASKINSDEIVNKLDGKIDRLEKYMNDQFQKLAQVYQKQGKKDGKDDQEKLMEEIKEVEQQNEIGQMELQKEEGGHQLKPYETVLMEMVKYKEMSKRLSRMFEHSIPMIPKKHQISAEAALQRATNLKPEELQYLLDIKKNELARMAKSNEGMHFPTQQKEEDESLGEKLEKMEEEMAKLEEKIDQKDEQLEENYDEICTLKEENSYLKRKLEEKEAKIELLEEKIDQKNEKLAEKDEEICALEEEIDGFKKEIGQKDQKLAEREAKIGALEDEIAEFKEKEKKAIDQQSTIKDFANLKMWDGRQLLQPFDSTNSFNAKSTKAPNSGEDANKTELKKAYPNVFGYCAGCEQGFLQTDWARQIGDLQYHVGCFKCDHCHRQLLTGEEFSQDSKVQHKNRPLGKMVPRILCKQDYMDLVIQKKPTQSVNATKVNNTGTKNSFYGCKWQID